ncbi:hypothetical protein B0A55_11133 [Friedmanniomyces simplex]|uniref:Hydrophobin n=1 Tax=Friedmanniomyces simplex TaxID=329884 RepID=A0A4U0WQC4_9PEZI|nr:hypothetical protein B0A55_11133 [Friedmanniomyces simplex]
MLPQTLLAFATLVVTALAAPKGPNDKVVQQEHKHISQDDFHPSTSTGTSTSTSTNTAASATPTINNGQIFINQCTNTGVSIADCSELLNIAALNGNSINVGGSASPSSGSVNNGQQFLNQCNNYGISVLDCAELLNFALLNGNSIDISLGALTSLLSSLGLPSGILGGLLPSGSAGSLVSLPTGVV